MSAPIVTREVERVRDLVRLAVDSGAAEAEARTAALAACKLIMKHGLIVLARMPEPLIVERVIEVQTAPPPRAAPPRPGPASRGRVIVSRYECTCRNCGSAIDVGDRVYWVRGEGSVHLECSEGDV